MAPRTRGHLFKIPSTGRLYRSDWNATLHHPVFTDVTKQAGVTTEDFDGDGNLDICMSMNDFATMPSHGRYDVLNGLVLRGDGKGKFTPLTIMQSGIFIPGNGKALVKLRGGKGQYFMAASQNKGPVKLFRLNRRCGFVVLNADDVVAEIVYKNGKHRRQETGYGNSFLSQSSRFIAVDSTVSSIEIIDSGGKKRKGF